MAQDFSHQHTLIHARVNELSRGTSLHNTRDPATDLAVAGSAVPIRAGKAVRARDEAAFGVFEPLAAEGRVLPVLVHREHVPVFACAVVWMDCAHVFHTMYTESKFNVVPLTCGNAARAGGASKATLGSIIVWQECGGCAWNNST